MKNNSIVRFATHVWSSLTKCSMSTHIYFDSGPREKANIMMEFVLFIVVNGLSL
jgi:hypothetical protein